MTSSLHPQLAPSLAGKAKKKGKKKGLLENWQRTEDPRAAWRLGCGLSCPGGPGGMARPGAAQGEAPLAPEDVGLRGRGQERKAL